jgi:hypothetical protein
VSAGAAEEIFDGGNVEQLEFFGALEQTFQLIRPRPDRQIEQRARNGGDRYPLPHTAVLGSEDR